MNGWRNVEALSREEFLELPGGIRRMITRQALGEDPIDTMLAEAKAFLTEAGVPDLVRARILRERRAFYEQARQEGEP
jgi:hypothetical protein